MLYPRIPTWKRVDPGVSDYTQVPLVASRHLLEQAEGYDLVGYMEDDLLLSDPEFFAKDSLSGSLQRWPLRLFAPPLRTHPWPRRRHSLRGS